MFPWIRWRHLAKRGRPRDASCVAAPPSTLWHELDGDACFYSPSSVADTTTEPVPSHLGKVPAIRNPFGIWNMATKLCSDTRRFFKNIWHCSPIRQFPLQCFSWLVPRRPQTFLQWLVQRKNFQPSQTKVNIEHTLPRRLSQAKKFSRRLSRTMTRGAALSRLVASQRGVSLSSWPDVRFKRRDWLSSKEHQIRRAEPWIRRACRYAQASCKKGVVQLKAIVQKTIQSMTDLRQRLLRTGRTENRRARRASQKEQRRAHRADAVTQQPLRWQLLSRAFTVAVYALGIECGKMLALPRWLRVVSAYSVAAIVPMLLPSAHGDNCRVASIIAASTLAATRVSIASAIGVSIVLWLCPAHCSGGRKTRTQTVSLRCCGIF